jgi:hypothetical protein
MLPDIKSRLAAFRYERDLRMYERENQRALQDEETRKATETKVYGRVLKPWERAEIEEAKAKRSKANAESRAKAFREVKGIGSAISDTAGNVTRNLRDSSADNVLNDKWSEDRPSSFDFGGQRRSAKQARDPLMEMFSVGGSGMANPKKGKRKTDPLVEWFGT